MRDAHQTFGLPAYKELAQLNCMRIPTIRNTQRKEVCRILLCLLMSD